MPINLVLDHMFYTYHHGFHYVGNVKQRGSEEKLSDARWGLPHSYSSYGHAGSERTSSESHKYT